jgi:hypothetical protein
MGKLRDDYDWDDWKAMTGKLRWESCETIIIGMTGEP